nr:hypothetical protein GCM10020093_038870 [Planobispora longispora]
MGLRPARRAARHGRGPVRGAGAACPEAVAVVAGGTGTTGTTGTTEITYAELNARANRLAHRLIALGAGPGRYVGLSVPRSPDMVVAFLAILKSGAAYLPLDPEHPAERLAVMLADAAPPITVTGGGTTAAIAAIRPDGMEIVDLDEWNGGRGDSGHGDGEYGDRGDGDYGDYGGSGDGSPGTGTAGEPRDTDPRVPILPGHPAYVVYTSGSTGRPKGVVVTHAGLPAYARTEIDRYAVTPDARVLQFASIGFDGAVLEWLMAFAGARRWCSRPPGCTAASRSAGSSPRRGSRTRSSRPPRWPPYRRGRCPTCARCWSAARPAARSWSGAGPRDAG